MPVKIDFTTEEYLKSTPLPVHGSSYTVIPHSTIIDHVKYELGSKGFEIEKEQYRSNHNANIASGVYYINHGNDPDMKMMFAWSNSYDKTVKFKCSIGSYVFVCMNGVLRGDIGNASRKHTGSALSDALGFIDSQISVADQEYNFLVNDKNMLKNIILTNKEKSELLGRLFLEEEILTLTQTGIVQKELKKPSFLYNADPDSAWALYNHVTHALKESHPTSYLDDHGKVHQFFINEFGKLTVGSQLVSTPVPVFEEVPGSQYELELESATNSVIFL